MRTWGRIPNPAKGDRIGIDFAIGRSAIGATAKEFVWVEVDTDANGYDDGVWLTTLVQCLKLNLGESPFFANYGIPAARSVRGQLPPDFYVTQTQRQFASHFASLRITKTGDPDPTYDVSVVTEQGATIEASIPV